MRSLLAILFLVAATASAQLQETPVSLPVLGPPVHTRSGPKTASDGTDFLAVWNDSRASAIGAAALVTRITQDGRVVDPAGKPLYANVPGIVIGVFWMGNAYAAVFSASSIVTNSGTYVVRLDRNGGMLDSPRFVTPMVIAAAASNGTRIIGVGSSADVIFDDAGNVVANVAAPASCCVWAAASNGSTFVTVRAMPPQPVSTIDARILDASGNVLESVSAVGSTQSLIAISQGAGYRIFGGVSGTDTFDFTDPVLRLVVPLTTATAAIGAGTDYFIATGRAVFRGTGLNVSAAPLFVAPDGEQMSEAALTSNGSEVLLTWNDGGFGARNRAVILGQNGQAITPVFNVTLSATEQLAPKLVTGGAKDIVVWQEREHTYLTRLSPEGLPLDGQGIVVQDAFSTSAGGAEFDGSAVAIAQGGAVQWIDPESGALLGPLLAIHEPVDLIRLTHDDVSVVIAGVSLATARAFVQRFGRAGEIGPPVYLSSLGEFVGAVRVASNGSEIVVGWDVLTFLPSPTDHIRLASATSRVQRLSAALAPVGSPVVVATYNASQFDGSPSTPPPTLASNGRDFLLAWVPNEESSTDGLYVRTISADVTLGPPVKIASGPGITSWDAAWDGNRWAVAYTAPRSGGGHDLILTHVGLGDRMILGGAPLDYSSPSFGHAPGRPLRIAFARTAREAGGVWRVFTRDVPMARRRLASH